MTVRPDSFNFPDAVHLGSGTTDRLARAVITLTKELCILTDRLIVIEAQLSKPGETPFHEGVDTCQPDEALRRRIDAATSRIINAVMTDFADGQG